MPETAVRPPDDLIRLVDAPRTGRYPYLTAGMVRTIREERRVRMWRIGRACYVSAAELDQFLAGGELPARASA